MEDVKCSFEDLIVYQKSLDFIDLVFNTRERFPKMETYILSSQFIRAANSVALNISEGFGNTDAQFNRYLQIALDSAKECVLCTIIGFRRKYISKDENGKIRVLLAELSKMITSLQKYLRNKTTNL